MGPTGPFSSMPQKPWHPGKGAKPDRVILFNCREVYVHASYKTTLTWGRLNNWGTDPPFEGTMINS